MMNEAKTIRLMATAIEELRDRLPDKYDIDDCQWNETGAFQFVIGWGTSPKNYKTTDPFRFYYDDDEEWAGTAEEQLSRFIDDVAQRF